MGYLCANLRAVRLRAGASPKAAFSAVTFRHVSCRLASSLHAPSSLSPSWSPKSPHTPPASSPKGLLFRLCASTTTSPEIVCIVTHYAAYYAWGIYWTEGFDMRNTRTPRPILLSVPGNVSARGFSGGQTDSVVRVIQTNTTGTNAHLIEPAAHHSGSGPRTANEGADHEEASRASTEQ